MSSSSIEVKCGNNQCRVSETGKCVEGFELGECPHIAHSDAVLEESIEESTKEDAEPSEEVPLAKSERFEISDTTRLLCATAVTTVAIVGPTSAGKTSLIASLCDLFQKGPVGQLRFSRSRTLFAFERACHHARAASLRREPETEHTSLGSGVGFYHLGLTDKATAAQMDLLIADRPGEDYRTCADVPAVSSEFVEVHRANNIALLIDGAQLLDVAARHNIRHDALMILQALVEGNCINKRQRLAIVLTKLDMIESAAADELGRVERDFDSIVALFQQEFGHAFAELQSFKVAASPKTQARPFGYGVAALLQYWVLPDPSPVTQREKVRASRALGRFGGDASRMGS